MLERNLFGVPVPPGAVRAVVRPSLQRGNVLPLWEGRIEGTPPSDAEILAEGARNEGFWTYVDALAAAGKLKAEPLYEWKLRLSFFDQNGAAEHATTTDTFEVFRSGGAGVRATDPSAQLFALFERAQTVLKETVSACSALVSTATTAAANTVSAANTAAAAAVAEATKAASTALAEASKQTSHVSALADKLHEETQELKGAIFKLQTERAQAGTAKKTTGDELKDLAETGKTLLSLADAFAGSKPAGAPTPKTGSA
jgi:hypothetical protein